MPKIINLTEGSIPHQIVKLSLPIMGTSFVQMAYNLMNMLWLGHLNSDSVASVGVASYFAWLGISLMLVARIGAEVGISQSLGSGNNHRAGRFAINSISLVLLLAAIWGVFTYTFAPTLISIFGLEQSVTNASVSYMRILACGSLFYYVNPTYTGTFNGTGNSNLPFKINAFGLIFNFCLDPFLIFGWAFFPKLGTDGAAIATVISQALVSILFIINLRKPKSPLFGQRFKIELHKEIILKICRFGLPVSLHSMLFATFSIFLARIITPFGALPIAVQSIGAQIEALSWMTAGGFSTALSVFTGQNFGANNWKRINRGFWITIGISATIGLMVTILFVFFGKSVFSLFIPTPEAIKLGATYLLILGISQLFMCLEITTGGAFNGLGRTLPPSIVGILLTGARIPLAMFLVQPEILGMTGVWWSVSISSILKGIVLFSWFIFFIRRKL